MSYLDLMPDDLMWSPPTTRRQETSKDWTHVETPVGLFRRDEVECTGDQVYLRLEDWDAGIEFSESPFWEALSSVMNEFAGQSFPADQCRFVRHEPISSHIPPVNRSIN